MSSLIMEERAKRVVKKEREDDGEIWKRGGRMCCCGGVLCREEFRLNYFGYLSLLEGMLRGPAGLSLQ